jgi:hypothetical protein
MDAVCVKPQAHLHGKTLSYNRTESKTFADFISIGKIIPKGRA